MDTRAKILDWTTAEKLIRELLAGVGSCAIVTGHFDPLLASHVQRLDEIAGDLRRLLIIVTNPERPLLSARARAELMAALGTVAYVTMAPASGLEELLASAPEDLVTREEDADRRLAAAFAAHVRDSHA